MTCPGILICTSFLLSCARDGGGDPKKQPLRGWNFSGLAAEGLYFFSWPSLDLPQRVREWMNINT